MKGVQHLALWLCWTLGGADDTAAVAVQELASVAEPTEFTSRLVDDPQMDDQRTAFRKYMDSIMPDRSPEMLAAMPFPPTAPMAYGWWILIFYMFYVMAIVCDDYLVPAVDVICEQFKIPEDVAGATLMAFACNGPELLTNACAIFITHSAVGMGTIVGSAIFNVLVIVGCCPISAPGGVLEIPWKNFLRDASFSGISIVIILWVLPTFSKLKATVLLGMAFVYTFVVAMSKKWFGDVSSEELKDLEEEMLKHRESEMVTRRVSYQGQEVVRRQSFIPDGRVGSVATNILDALDNAAENLDKGADDFVHDFIDRRLSTKHHPDVTAAEAYGEGPQHREEMWTDNKVEAPHLGAKASCCEIASSWFLFMLTMPTDVVLYWTIPDIKREEKRHLYLPAFLLSMFWLSSTAFVVCYGSAFINLYWGIPESFLGLTLVSVGTSFPNLWASVITARAGRGPIAVSNALGSNVQNVFLVLALPIWFYVMIHGSYYMEANDITMSVLWMGFALGVAVVGTALQGFKLTSKLGWLFCGIYLIYLVQATFAG